MPIQKGAHVYYDPESTNTDVSAYISAFTWPREKAQIDNPAFDKDAQQTEHGIASLSVSLNVKVDSSDTFRGLMRTHYTGETDMILAWRRDDASVSATNIEHRFKLQVTSLPEGGTWGELENFTVTLRSNESIQSVDGSAWTDMHTGASATVF